MDPWHALNELATEQFGRVHIRQAQSAGIAPSTVREAARRLAWRRPLPGVIVLPGAPRVHEGRLAEAVLAVGEPVLVAGWSAAWLWGLVKAPPSIVEVVVPHTRRRREFERVLVHRSRTLDDADAAEVRGLPVTTVVRTLCDLSAVTDVETLRGLVIDARQRRLATVEEIVARAAELDGLKGLGSLRQVLWELDRSRADSVLEHRLRIRLRDRGLGPAPHPWPVDVGDRTLHIDIAWPEQRVGIEVDGFGSHSERESLHIDIQRHNALELAGWRIIRAGWHEAGPGFPAWSRGLERLLEAVSA